MKNLKKHNQKKIATPPEYSAAFKRLLGIASVSKKKQKPLTLGGLLTSIIVGKKLLTNERAFEGPPAVKSWAEKMNVPYDEALRRWRKAETIANKKFKIPPLTKSGTFQKTPTGKFWRYAMAIFKKMMYQASGQSKAKGRKAILKRAAEHPPAEPGPRLRRRKSVGKLVRNEDVIDKEITMASLDERVKRMKKAAIKARSKAAKKPMTASRKKKAKAAKKWRMKHKSQVRSYAKKYKARNEGVDVSYEDAIDLVREGFDPKLVANAMISGDFDELLNSALPEEEMDESMEKILDIAEKIENEELDESALEQIVDELDDEEVEILDALMSEEEDEDEEEDIDEDFDAYYAKMKKGNPKLSLEGAKKMYSALKAESEEGEDEEIEERSRWKKELSKKYGKMPAGLAKHAAGKVAAKAAGAGSGARGTGAQVNRMITKRGEMAKKGKWGTGSKTGRTGKAQLRQRYKEIMGRDTKGTRGSRSSLKKKLRGIATHRTRKAAGVKAYKTKKRREASRANLVKARAAKAAKRG